MERRSRMPASRSRALASARRSSSSLPSARRSSSSALAASSLLELVAGLACQMRRPGDSAAVWFAGPGSDEVGP